MPKVTIPEVSLRGSGGINVTTEGVYIGYRFRASMSLQIAKALKQDTEAYEKKEGGGYKLRPFPEFKLAVKIPSAVLTMYKDMGLEPTMVEKDVEIRDFIVKREDSEAFIEFQVRVPLSCPEMIEWVVTQKKEPAPQFVLNGKQEEIDFEPPAEDSGPEQKEFAA